MNEGYSLFKKVKELERQAESAGFELTGSKFSYQTDKLVLIPKGDNFPIYSRDAEFFYETLSEIKSFLDGVEWCENYYKQLRLITEEKVKKSENNFRNRKLLQMIKESEDNYD